MGSSDALLFPPLPIWICLYPISSTVPACLYRCLLPFCRACTIPGCVHGLRSCQMVSNGHLHCQVLPSLHPVVLLWNLQRCWWARKLFCSGKGYAAKQVGFKTCMEESRGGESRSVNIFKCQSIIRLWLGCSLGNGTCVVAAPPRVKTSRRKTHVESERQQLLWMPVFPHVRLTPVGSAAAFYRKW